MWSGPYQHWVAKIDHFGGSIEVSELKDYRYKALMPKFDDKVNLKTFTSFDEGSKNY
jgi:hypothetical protein